MSMYSYTYTYVQILWSISRISRIPRGGRPEGINQGVETKSRGVPFIALISCFGLDQGDQGAACHPMGQGSGVSEPQEEHVHWLWMAPIHKYLGTYRPTWLSTGARRLGSLLGTEGVQGVKLSM